MKTVEKQDKTLPEEVKETNPKKLSFLEKKNQEKENKNDSKDKKFWMNFNFNRNEDPKSSVRWPIAILIISGLFFFFWDFGSYVPKEINIIELEDMLKKGDVAKIAVIDKRKQVEVTLSSEALQKPRYSDQFAQLDTAYTMGRYPVHFIIKVNQEYFEKRFDEIQSRLDDGKKMDFSVEERQDFSNWFFSWGILFVLIFIFWFIIRRLSTSGAGAQIFNIGKSRATLFDAENKVKITFHDIAGLEEAKEEVQEVVDFLKHPDKYTNLGGKIPKGVLLVGDPGTGKTLLAKAVAGEANVPFFSLSGSDFVEMFVGVGAARVRDLFRKAKDKAPCIIFIDEVDAIGRSRGKSQMPGSNDERENTLNSLLVEMDGFATDAAVILLAATNRPDVLDNALLRPGRFDRQISIDKPDITGREAIFKVHLKNIKCRRKLDIKHLAAQTPGFAGAEIANVCNEAALIAARKNKKTVSMPDFQDAIDRTIGGLEKKNKIISSDERRIVAYHEAGHAVTGWFLKNAHPLLKVTIVPRGVAALGYAQYIPKEQFLYTTEQLEDEVCMALGGRVAEDIIFDKVSTGALNDLEKVTKIAYSMVANYGMNKEVGNVSFHDSSRSEYQFSKPYSEATASKIDVEVKKFIQYCYEKTKGLLEEKRLELETIAEQLLKKEILFKENLEELIGKRPFDVQNA